MKRRKELFLITLIALFVLSSVISINLNSDLKKTDKNIQYDEINEIDEINQLEKFREPKKSWFNNSMDPIIIDNQGTNNWTWARTKEWCQSGDGSWDNPYIIENITIDTGGSGPGIVISNSINVYFEINNCTVHNSGSGIRLYNTNNGKIINNNFSLNEYGIFLLDSNNNTISGNTVNNNTGSGIFLYMYNNNNTISGNTANDNTNGICLFMLDNNNNTISGNTVNNNIYGIYLFYSNNNTISANTLVGNVFFIEEKRCIGNTIEDNNRCYTKILLSGINELKIEPYGVNDIDVNLTIALDDETEVLFSAFNESKIEDAPLNDGLIFMNLKLNDSNNLNQTFEAPINITLKSDFSKYEIIEALWFNKSADAWEEIPFIDLGNGVIVISINHASIFALTEKEILNPSLPSKDDDDTNIKSELNKIIILIFIVILTSIGIISSFSIYKLRKKELLKTKTKHFNKKEFGMKKPLESYINKEDLRSIIPEKTFSEISIIENELKKIDPYYLEDCFKNKNLIYALKEKNILEKPELFSNLNITITTSDFWEKLDKLNLNEKDKIEFMKTLFSFPLEEREKIIDRMLKLKRFDIGG